MVITKYVEAKTKFDLVSHHIVNYYEKYNDLLSKIEELNCYSLQINSEFEEIQKLLKSVENKIEEIL